MGMELGREGQLQVNNCHEYYCSAWSKLNTEIGPNTHPPQTFGPLSRGVEGSVVATSTQGWGVLGQVLLHTSEKIL